MFKVIIDMKQDGEFSNFPEAFAHLARAMEKIKEKGAVYNTLDKTCFISWETFLPLQDYGHNTGDHSTTRHVLNWPYTLALAFYLGLIDEHDKLKSVTVLV